MAKKAKIKTGPDPGAGDTSAAETAAKGGVEEAAAEEVVTGPRIKLEDGPFVAVPEGDQRQRRLLYAGSNIEHVSEVEDQGETVWVYRRM